jgi:phosphate starvation-inducible PhoH-like protein
MTRTAGAPACRNDDAEVLAQPPADEEPMSEPRPTADERSEARVVHRVTVPPVVAMVELLGTADEVLRAIEDGFPSVVIHARGNEVSFAGPAGDVALAVRLVDELVETVAAGTRIGPEVVGRSIAMLTTGTQIRPADVLTFDVLSSRGRTIRPKTAGQKEYVDAIDRHTLTFGIGPAGTGKTYLAMAKAVQALQARRVNRIVLTRPAVEAGERLGFLPGSLSEKIDPYLRPLYDALHDMVDPESIPRLLEAGTIEVAPLAYMRGRTLDDSFIILDEAQNTTSEQMKMFLTRMGFGSTVVVTGDVTQVDLPLQAPSGLREVEQVLADVDDVAFCRLTSADVVRHRLVAQIIDAYAEAEHRRHTVSRPSSGPSSGTMPS